MSSITINGKPYVGNNIVIRRGVVTIDGKVQDSVVDGVVEVKVTGPLVSLETDASVICQDVGGNVTAGGSVSSVEIGGNVNAGGSVNCGGKIAGSINAGGSVRAG